MTSLSPPGLGGERGSLLMNRTLSSLGKDRQSAQQGLGLHRTLLSFSERNVQAPQNVPFPHLHTKANQSDWLIRNRQRE